MSNNLALIHRAEVLGKDFKMYGDIERPLFLGSDVAEWIEHTNVTVMLETLDTDERCLNIVYTSSGPREAWFITEDGLYEILMTSRKPIAKTFKKQVKEILRSVRKHGAYMTPETIERTLSDPDFIINLATQLKEERQKRLAAENVIQLNAPRVIFAESVEISKDCILVRAMAKSLKQNGVETGEKRFFAMLRSDGYLEKGGKNYNLPTQKSMDLGLFKVQERTINVPDGEPRLKRTPYVTGKGQVYFTNMFLEAIA